MFISFKKRDSRVGILTMVIELTGVTRSRAHGNVKYRAFFSLIVIKCLPLAKYQILLRMVAWRLWLRWYWLATAGGGSL